MKITELKVDNWTFWLEPKMVFDNRGVQCYFKITQDGGLEFHRTLTDGSTYVFYACGPGSELAQKFQNEYFEINVLLR